MISEKIKHRLQHRLVIHSRPQRAGIEPGERKQPVRPLFVAERPGQRHQRERHGVLVIGWAKSLAIGAIGTHD